MYGKKILLIFWAALVCTPYARSQDDVKIQQLFEDAIQAMGGDAYLNVKDMVSDGQVFYFDREGRSPFSIWPQTKAG